jgi:hypothetical protein
MWIENRKRHTVAAGVRDRTGVRADSCDTATVFADTGKAEVGTWWWTSSNFCRIGILSIMNDGSLYSDKTFKNSSSIFGNSRWNFLRLRPSASALYPRIRKRPGSVDAF